MFVRVCTCMYSRSHHVSLVFLPQSRLFSACLFWAEHLVGITVSLLLLLFLLLHIIIYHYNFYVFGVWFSEILYVIQATKLGPERSEV